ncbi:MAG: fluoride efflux transporter CrcB [Gammaproteobacteria bacterium]
MASSILAIAAGGALGAVLRYWTSTGVHSVLGREFPYGTLTVNVTGSLLMGVLTALLMERVNLGPEWRAGLLIGVLGSFTTFSTFSYETLALIEHGDLGRAAMNVFLSIVLCLLAVGAGLLIGRQI